MDVFDDYEDEMFRRLSAERADAILEGRGPTDDPLAFQLAATLEDLRLELLEEPTPEVAARHLAAMTAEPSWRSDMTTQPKLVRRRLRVAVVGFAACLVLFGGLAVAGALPEPAQDAVADAAELVGFDLPGGSSEQGDEASEHGKAVSETARSDELSGCEKGMAVAEVATSKAEVDPDLPEGACARDEETEGARGGGGAGRNDEASGGGGAGGGGSTENRGAGGGGGSGGTEQGSGGFGD